MGLTITLTALLRRRVLNRDTLARVLPFRRVSQSCTKSVEPVRSPLTELSDDNRLITDDKAITPTRK